MDSNKLFLKLILTLFFVVSNSGIAQEVEENDPLVILYSEFEPMAFTVNGEPTGFDIDLWKAIAEDANLNYVFKEVPFRDLLPSIYHKKGAVGLSGITITYEREETHDFSHPYFESGLLLLTKKNSDTDIVSAASIMLSDKALLKALLWFLIFILACGHLIWLTERGENSVINDRYFPGIFEAFWFVFITMTTIGYGDIAPKQWLGRLTTVFLATSGIVFFGWFIAIFSAAMNKADDQRVHATITSPHHLEGFKIATKTGSTSIDMVKSSGGEVVSLESISNAYLELLLNKVDGVVFDSPGILHQLKQDETQQLTTVGGLFEKQSYGFVLPEGSPLRERINRSILLLKRTGKYDEIYNKWFKNKETQ